MLLILGLRPSLLLDIPTAFIQHRCRFYTAYIPQVKCWASLQAFLPPQMKICIKQFNYSAIAATSPIIAEVGQRRGETSDAAPENIQKK